jgi:hypothetical protein
MAKQHSTVSLRGKFVWTRAALLTALALSLSLAIAPRAHAAGPQMPAMTQCATCHLASTSSVAIAKDKAGQWLDSAHAERGIGPDRFRSDCRRDTSRTRAMTRAASARQIRRIDRTQAIQRREHVAVGPAVMARLEAARQQFDATTAGGTRTPAR